MVSFGEIFALSKVYPLFSVIFAMILFFIGLKVTAKIFKGFFWVLAIIAIIVAVYMLFL